MKNLLLEIGFSPKENEDGVFIKKYSSYSIEADLKNRVFNYGGKIIFSGSKKTTQNITKPEDFVVFECVNRLLEKGYKPEDIILEKIYPSGHGTSGRLDVLVKKEGKAFLMIECKTWGAEFEKEFKKIQKDGGQLFTYFQQDRDTEYLMLYTSVFENTIKYKNEIIKIEESYRETSNVKDFYDRWSKFTKQNGVFDDWVQAYEFKSKALTLSQLKPITQKDSSFIFNRFLEILRHNVVSDKPNAFNKIFTLFLCKIIDENRNPEDELEFQWVEGVDNDISFQKRLTDLYKRGMKELLTKEVTDISDNDFNKKYAYLSEEDRTKILGELTRIRLEKNNEFAIKEVFDKETFTENTKVLKEIVELLQEFKIRYTEKQQYLSDFFELLLTTGLKQESGQFFTPVPIARFICRSIPLEHMVQEKLQTGNINDLIPTIIDYAAGSGHFLTESMDEMQKIIDKVDEDSLLPQIKRKIKSWKEDQFDWAYDYIYGIEKDYRLVKTAKVGCYLHGDGLAKVIHGDGLDNFKSSKEYKEKLKSSDKDFPQDNKQFDLVVSNPPYSVSAFKGNLKKGYAEKDFDLYQRLTDQSSEIECLFIERTKQLLKDSGIAAIILPSSILTNAGIYTQTREIVLKYFEVIAITELGSNTFMATGTNTVILFLRRRNNYDWQNINSSIERFFVDLKDVTVNGIENVFSKYVNYVWENLTLEDYKSLCEKKPNEKVQNHEIFVEYRKKLKVKNENELLEKIIEREKDKLLYFILAYSQKIVLVKSGEKQEEKTFLGYEFSFRRGSEGIHPIQRGKSIDDCTKLFDPQLQENPEKASSYIFQAFNGDLDSEIHETLKNHVSRVDLIDTLTFDRADFEKTVNLSVKKKIKYNDIWKTRNLVFLGEISNIQKGTSITARKIQEGNIPVVAGGQNPAYFHNISNRTGNIITVSASGAYSGFVNYFNQPIFASDCNTIQSKDESYISTKLIYNFLKNIQKEIYFLQRGQAQPHVYAEDLATIKIPLPPKEIQEKIVKEIGGLEIEGSGMKGKVEKIKGEIQKIINNLNSVKKVKISDFAIVRGGKRIPKGKSFSPIKTDYPYIRVSDFKQGTVEMTNLRYIDEEIFNQIRNYTISKDDIYISIAGTIGLVGIVPQDLDGRSLTENAAKIVINDQNDQKYVCLALGSNDVKRQIKEKTKAMGVPKLALKRIETIQIPLPSLSEQQRIVSEIEKNEAQISELERKLIQIPKQKEKILKKYLLP